MKEAILILTFGLFFLLASGAFAGGENYPVDPLNGCYAKADSTSGDPKVEADFINNRGRYRIIVDRYMSATECWKNKARCLCVPVECYRDGKVVYGGQVHFWNGR